MLRALDPLLNQPGELASFLANLWSVLVLSLGASPRAPQMALAYVHPGWLAVVVAMLAGGTQMIGNSVVLFFYRVRPWRLIAGLLMAAILNALKLICFGAILWLTASLVLRTPEPPGLITLVVCLGSAPLIFGALAMGATLGEYVNWVIHPWSCLATLLMLRSQLRCSLWQALVCLLFAWLLAKCLKLAFARPLLLLSRSLWGAVTGAEFSMSQEGQAVRRGTAQREMVLRLSESVGARLYGYSGLPAEMAAHPGDAGYAGSPSELLPGSREQPGQAGAEVVS